MTTNFERAVNKVLAHEGGFVNDPADPGGATNLGITIKTLSDWLGFSASVDDVRNLTRGTAVSIYKENYWDAVRGDQILSYPIAFSLFDQAVNKGPSKAIQFAQEVLGVYPSGRMDSELVDRINNSDERDFVNKFLDRSEKHYYNLVSSNSTLQKFLNGWLYRINSIRTYVEPYMGMQSKMVETQTISTSSSSKIPTALIAILGIGLVGAGAIIIMSKRKA